MAQQEILDVLIKNKEPMHRKQIAEKLNIRPEKVSITLKTLLKNREIKCIELDRFEARKYIKKINRKMRLYYV